MSPIPIPSVLPKQPVLIIGAGIAGLTLANGLHHRGIPYELYERDDGQFSRAQGYRIRLNLVGLHGLRDVLPPDVYERVKETCAVFVPGMTVHTADGHKVVTAWQLPGDEEDTSTTEVKTRHSSTSLAARCPPGIDLDDDLTRLAMASRLPADRARLRQVLLSSLDPLHLHFSRSFEAFRTDSKGVIARFSDGTESPLGSILIGADGSASSVTARALGGEDHPLRPIKTGAKMIFGLSPLTATLESEMLSELEEGIHVIRDHKGVSLFVETCRYTDDIPNLPPRPEDYVYWVLTDPKGYEEDLALAPDVTLPDMRGTSELQSLALKYLEGWCPGFRAVITNADVSKMAIWPMISSAPQITKWPTNRRVTFLGDAVHAVVPIGGLGGNMAIRSVQTLLETLVTNVESREGDGWSEAVIGQWEEIMRQEAETQSTLAREASGGNFLLPAWDPVVKEMAGAMGEI